MAMRVISTIDEMREEIRLHKQREATIGFVPTMGALHEGHLSLIRRAREENDVVAISIFVNPTQFDEEQDFDGYPRELAEDSALAEAEGVDIVFTPEADAMYDPQRDTVVMVNRLADHLCGISRGRGHFIGVCTVCTKLFNIVQPDAAYFGQKDAQQALIIQRMVTDLNLALRIEICPIVREEDGLALSSRNRNIPEPKRQSALGLYKALCSGRELIRTGVDDAQAVFNAMMESLLADENLEVDYLHIVSPETLEDVEKIDAPVLMAGAIRVGGVRLIDNVLVGPDGPWEE